MDVTVTPMRKRPTTLESITNNNGMRVNSPTNYSPVESVSLNAFKLNFKPEVPKALRKITTPNRPTTQPWGKPGMLPSNAPPRRQRSRKANRRNKKRQSRRRH